MVVIEDDGVEVVVDGFGVCLVFFLGEGVNDIILFLDYGSVLLSEKVFEVVVGEFFFGGDEVLDGVVFIAKFPFVAVKDVEVWFFFIFEAYILVLGDFGVKVNKANKFGDTLIRIGEDGFHEAIREEANIFFTEGVYGIVKVLLDVILNILLEVVDGLEVVDYGLFCFCIYLFW